MIQYEKVKEIILERLKTELPTKLFYHGIPHTTDVLNAVEQIAKSEKIDDAKTLILLRTAALFHDSGYIIRYEANEPLGCDIARTTLPTFGYDEAAIESICEMIMSTAIPQTPKNKLEMILCDADLDYLGRNDFDSISNKLRNELSAHGKSFTDMEWVKFEISFLEKHEYFTSSERKLRTPGKLKHMEELKKTVASIAKV
jgi:predicted metal-dependent HD superfamily phosphohydrolase